MTLSGEGEDHTKNRVTNFASNIRDPVIISDIDDDFQR